MARRFGSPRPSGNQPSHSSQAHGNQVFQPLPNPTGSAPFRLALDSILSPHRISTIQHAGKIVFHIAGDVGGIQDPTPQLIVARKLVNQLYVNESDRPAFFYIAGDVVYFNGQTSGYFPQFYQAYEHYNAPIFAVPGNHDGDPGHTGETSLSAFFRNFCSHSPVLTHEAGEVERDAMTQPNCYFTLNAPFVTIVGLYSNVPEGGQIHQDQIDWLVNELREAPRNKALLVVVHHPAFSFDDHHSGSTHIRDVLDDAFERSGRIADAVITGHVHNYQRFTRTINGRQVPYLVVGAGGYHHLHSMRKGSDGRDLQVPLSVPSHQLVLEDYADDRHGFMRITVDANRVVGEYFTVPRRHESWRAEARKYDSFALDWVNGSLVPHST
ncbi:MAG: metallophosphoesterase [Pirellulales bacterium]